MLSIRIIGWLRGGHHRRYFNHNNVSHLSINRGRGMTFRRRYRLIAGGLDDTRVAILFATRLFFFLF